MIVTGVEAKNRETLHGHTRQCLKRIQAERNLWRILQLMDYELCHRKRTKVMNRLMKRFDVKR